ncbi:uncharacterized protein LOC108107544 [Drosophila eugracilis]|uniref:uncharacterized protein LOC108107544 n=1 Tax=Drosophila eugracilis TaxID=29029 RepID=UPI0007E82368|nr:uncharacterized protein LOC108107544 [Drosophila eugracilis]
MATTSSWSPGSNNKPPSQAVSVTVPRPSMLHFEPYESQRFSRGRYIVLVYLLVVVLLLLALVQWELVSGHKPFTDFFLANYWLSASCMLISAPLLAIYLLVRRARYMPILGWVLLCLIVAYCREWLFLLYFAITAILVAISVLIGSFIPWDLTANVAILFLFIMYHAQLIRGWRYAELYTTDGLLAVIVLFCHFCIILMVFCFLDFHKPKDVGYYDCLGEALSFFARRAMIPITQLSLSISSFFLGQTTQDVRRLLSLLVDIIITSIILDHTRMTTTAKVAVK